ncbi:MAG: hypothetical protein H6737_17995 [Alphaproteobacteria bacterium]|nr:hypothetical protein [Alphaproteobacteria bacterium]
MNRFLLASLVLAVACSGGDKDETADTDTTPPTPDDTAPTGTDRVFAPAAFGVGIAEFAIDGEGNARSFSGFDSAGNPVEAQVVLSVLILDETATTSINELNSCQVSLGVAGPIAPDGAGTWTETANVHWGFHLPAGSPVVGNTCANFTFPEVWGDVASKVQQWDWGFAINEMDPQVLPQLEAGFGANWAAIEDSVVGAGWYSNILATNPNTPGGYADGGFVIGSEVNDADFSLVVDGAGNPQLLDADTVWFSGANLPGTGAYTGQGVIYIQPADFIVQTPQ